MTGQQDPRPTRTQAERVLRDDPPLCDCGVALGLSGIQQAVATLDRAGFIRPEPREPGWYAVRWTDEDNWRPEWWSSLSLWGKGVGREPFVVGPRIAMPDEAPE